jgi:uncharacterized protein (TIGR00251 family)
VTILSLNIQPRAKRTEVVGRHDNTIKIRLRAPPVDGAANRELISFISSRLGISRSAIAIVSGRTSRRKRVSIQGVSEPQALHALGLGDAG